MVFDRILLIAVLCAIPFAGSCAVASEAIREPDDIFKAHVEGRSAGRSGGGESWTLFGVIWKRAVNSTQAQIVISEVLTEPEESFKNNVSFVKAGAVASEAIPEPDDILKTNVELGKTNQIHVVESWTIFRAIWKRVVEVEKASVVESDALPELDDSIGFKVEEIVAADDLKKANDDVKPTKDTDPKADDREIKANVNVVEALAKDIDAFKKKLETKTTDDVIESTALRDGAIYPLQENEPVKSSFGKVTVGGLTQIWYETVQNDRSGVFHGAPTFAQGSAAPPKFLNEANAGNQNDTFRVRRTEMRLKFQISDMISATIVMDPAREGNSLYSPIPTLLRHNSKTTISNDFRNGTVSSFHPSLLQDAYILLRDFDKGFTDSDSKKAHHTFAFGQFKPPAGEEAGRDSGSLDFVERAMVTGVNNVRDVGAMVIGKWFDDRLNYKVGFFNGPSGTVLTDPEVVEAGNRPDDNSAKDIAFSISGSPWNIIDKKTQAWNGLEMGYFRTDGVHGGAGQEFDPNINSLNDINRRKTHISRQGAYMYLKPNKWAQGLWLRGEWGRLHDIYGGDTKTTSLGLGSVDVLNNNVRGFAAFSQANPNPVTITGWFASAGFKMADSKFSERLAKKSGALGKELNKMEFCVRAESFQNVATEDLERPDRRTNLFSTRVYTTGVNYQMNSTSRFQMNYVQVDDPSSKSHFLSEVKNNVFVINWQLKY